MLERPIYYKDGNQEYHENEAVIEQRQGDEYKITFKPTKQGEYAKKLWKELQK